MMTVKTIGEPVLAEKAAPVDKIDDNIRTLVKEMIDTMINENGIGLAAPQVGVLRKIFVCRIQDNPPFVFINPEIISTSPDTCSYEEGCLSIPGMYADIIRPAEITIQAFNEMGKPFTIEAEGILARVIQHENDHLNGKLFIEYLSDKKRDKLLKVYEKKRKK